MRLRYFLLNLLILILSSDSLAADVRESFPTTENGSGAGVPLTSVQSGSSPTSANGSVGFSFLNPSGNLTLPEEQGPNNAIVITLVDGYKNTYAGAVTITPATAATDIACLSGSSTKTIRITEVRVSAIGTTANTIPLRFILRSTADSGGTSETVTDVPYSTSSPGGTAVLTAYTANPTTGTSIGPIKIDRLTAALLGTIGTQTIWDFGNKPAQAVILQGTSNLACINFNSSSITGGSVSFSYEWTEE